uniref:Kazal-like domain-containing protein n=1 Tax=Clastoptera arizonana TaxID=38151 RepID=A0A1B6C0M3_9HEMI
MKIVLAAVFIFGFLLAQLQCCNLAECIDEYAPVCGFNHFSHKKLKFRNRCFLAQHNLCEGTSFSLANMLCCTLQCPKDDSPVCGYDQSNHQAQTFDSDCYLYLHNACYRTNFMPDKRNLC